MTCLILEPGGYSHAAIDVYRDLFKDVRLCEGNWITERVDDVIVIVVKLKYTLTADFLAKFPNLRIVASSTTGLTHIDLVECERREIKVISLRDGLSGLHNVTSTAELTIGLIVDVVRNFSDLYVPRRLKAWRRPQHPGHQLSSMKIGIVGAGRIGNMVIASLGALGCKGLYYDTNPDVLPANEGFVKAENLRDLCSQSDLISMHVRYDVGQNPVITADLIDLMKNDVILVNSSRGGVIDEAAVCRGVTSGKIFGYAADVLSGEDLNAVRSSELVDLADRGFNVRLTPHIGGYTSEGMEHTEILLAQLVCNYWGIEFG